MAWEETRGSSRVALAAVRHVAHADDAKSRTDEATRVPTRSLRPRVLTAVGAGAVVLALVSFLAFRGNGDDQVPVAARAGATPSPAVATSTEPAEPTADEVLAASMPSGEWKLVIVGRTSTTRGGTTTPQHQKGKAVTWTFPAAACSDTQCSGSVASSSGREFPFTWNGRRLTLEHGNDVERDKKRACVDTVTGEVRPIEQSAARVTYHYSYGTFTGTPDLMVAPSTTRTTYEFFGDCQPQPRDEVKSTWEWRLTPVDTT